MMAGIWLWSEYTAITPAHLLIFTETCPKQVYNPRYGLPHVLPLTLAFWWGEHGVINMA